MSNTLKEPMKMKVFPKGQVVIPIALRERYDIAIGDQIDVVPTPDGILLKTTSEKENQKSMTDRLFGVFRDYAIERPKLKKQDIALATKNEFVEGWKK